MSASSAPSATLDRDALLAQARGLFEFMRERAPGAEDERHLLPDMVAAFTEAGLVRTLVPHRFGGAGLGLTDAFDVTIEVARAYGSIGWVGSFWSMLGGLVPRDGAPPENRQFLVPTSEVTVIDTWFNAGLRGTGSDNVIADGVFVPEYRTLPMESVREGRSPGSSANTDPHFRAPLMTHAGYAMVGPAIGIARGMIDDWSANARAKAHSYTKEQAAATVPMQMQLAESAALVDTAELLVRRCLERVQSDAEPTLDDRVRNRRDISFAARLLTRAVDDLMQTAGASAMRDESPIQRGWRDVRTIGLHVMLNFNAAAENYGRHALGLPLNPRDPFF